MIKYITVGKIYGRVVQLVRMPACHAGGRGFEPLLGRKSKRTHFLVGAFLVSNYMRGLEHRGGFCVKKTIDNRF